MVAVNVARRDRRGGGEFRAPLLVGARRCWRSGALGFATFDASTPDWQSLVFMALIGLGIGPTLSGLQIALQRTVAPAAIGGAMGTLLLLRQVGGAVALAARRPSTAPVTIRRRPPAWACSVGLAGSAIAAAALISLPRAAGRLPAPPPGAG